MNDTEKQFDSLLEEAAKEARAAIAAGTDKGHTNLITDLKDLLAEAEACEFHDQLCEKYPAPKMALSERLLELRQRMIDGNYDN